MMIAPGASGARTDMFTRRAEDAASMVTVAGSLATVAAALVTSTA